MDLLENCLIIGVTEKEFWNMSYGEAIRTIEAYNKREKYNNQRQASNIYILSQLIADNIAPMLSKDHKPREYMEIFGHLYDAEEVKKQDEEKELKEVQLQSAKFKMFAEMQNRRRAKK